MIKKIVNRKHYLVVYLGVGIVIAALSYTITFELNNLLRQLLIAEAVFAEHSDKIDKTVEDMYFISLVAVNLFIVLSMVVIYYVGRTYFLRPMMELEKMSKSVEETKTLLVQQEKLASIGELAAGVAHELNNPIGFVNSNINALKDYIPELAKYIDYLERKTKGDCDGTNPANDIEFIMEDIPELVDESLEGLSRVTSIVKSLKDYARVDLEDRIDYNINDGIEATLTVSRNTYKYVAKIEKELEEVPLLVVNGNQINEVLLNLFVNAAEAIEEQGRKEKGLISISTYFDDDYVYCSVKDDGPGITEENIRRIFDPFFTTKEPGKGTGLGLNIAYNTITNKHNGDLIVASTLGEGTTFTIKLPIPKEVGLYEED